MKNVFKTLEERGYIYQYTNLEKINEILDNKQIVFYLGIDPTADSLHIGHFFALTMVRRLQDAGHKAIIVIGGATALIGDPTGRSDLRKMLTKEQVLKNKEEVKKLISRFVRTDGKNPALILDNSDWLNEKTYIDFMRDIGIHFNVNNMLSTDIYKKRLQSGGLTFLEMGYMLMQAFDFVYLNQKYGCVLQIGGSDQWPNILAGVDLAKKLSYSDNNFCLDTLYGLTCPLLVKADGEKMGKSAKGTLWVSREKTTVYDFYQMFMNSFDEDVFRLLSFFTDFEMKTIKEMCESDIIKAKKIMAFEVTKLVHGQEEALKVQQASQAIFDKGVGLDGIPTFKVKSADYKNGITVTELLVIANLAPSKSEAKRLIQAGAVTVDNLKIDDVNTIFNLKSIAKKELILKKGKKQFARILMS